MVTVDASMYAVTTQDRCSAPPSSPTIVGSAVETIVWSRGASNIASISPPKIAQIAFRRQLGGTLRRRVALGYQSIMIINHDIASSRP